jgi:Na+-exporting ATPase
MGNDNNNDAVDSTKHDHQSGQANKPLSRPPHALPYPTVIEEIKANPLDGLTASEARSRLEEHGPNDIGNQGGVSIAKLLIRQIANAMILVLIIAMVVSFSIKSWVCELLCICGIFD